jgi:hypothetical protein
MAAGVVSERSAICRWCGASFTPAGRRGPPARYCRHSHRQRAHEERAFDEATADALAVRWLFGRLTGVSPPDPPSKFGRPSGRLGRGRFALFLEVADGPQVLLGRYVERPAAEFALARRRRTYERVVGARMAARLSWQVVEPG